MNKTILTLFSIAVTFVLHQSHSAQTDPKIPDPEFYGIYAIVDGKLCGITVPTSGCDLETTEFKRGSRNASALVVKKDLHFLIYQENPTQFVQNLDLRPFVYVRRNVHRDILSQRETVTEENRWTAFGIGDFNVSAADLEPGKIDPVVLLVKPYQDRMVIVVPSKPLTDGPYLLSGKDFSAKGEFHLWYGQKETAESDRCVVMFSLLVSTYELNPCGTNAKRNRTTRSPENTDPAQSELMAKLTAIQTEIIDAGFAGDVTPLEKYLDANYTYFDETTNRKLDRKTYIEKMKKQESVKSLKCFDRKLSATEDKATMTGTCEVEVKKLLMRFRFRYSFKEEFVRRDSQWKILTTEIGALEKI